MNGLDWQTWTMRFSAGLNTGADERTLDAPELAKAFDCQFDETGGIQTRYPYQAALGSILGGGTISDARRLVSNGGELLCFTKENLYSWSPGLSVWVSKGTHVAVKVEERARFIAPTEQASAERAELNGVIVYAWVELPSPFKVWLAAVDSSSGVVIMPPVSISGTDSQTRPRLIALSTRILLLVDNITTLRVNAVSIDPANVTTSAIVAATAVGSAAHDSYYDACRIGDTDSAIMVQRLNPDTSYAMTTITAALATTTTTKARTCERGIAVAVTPDGLQAQIIRTSGTSVLGDLMTVSSHADVYTAQAVGTTPTAAAYLVTCAFRSVQNSGAYRCYAFWNADGAVSGVLDETASGFYTKYNYVTNANTIGTQATLAYHLLPCSRAFDRNGSVYMWASFVGASLVSGSGGAWTIFGGTLQNCVFMYRDDGSFHAKAMNGDSGIGANHAAWLPTVQALGDERYAVCLVERRRVPLGGAREGYSDRGPREVIVTFDSNEARRTARLGSTLYITGGEILQYDGARLTECGFHLFPWALTLNTGIAGSITDGSYAYKVTWRWDNANGETDRSTTATVAQATISAGPKGVQFTVISPLQATHKTTNKIAAEFWRTAVSPTDDSPFYLVTNSDPAHSSNPNRYLYNDYDAASIARLDDTAIDSSITGNETNRENGGILENLAPPAATIIVASDSRLFIAGVAGDPDRVWYSKQRSDGEVAAFHDALTVVIPATGGQLTGLGFMNGSLVVFRETAAYALLGDGFDNAGGGQNYVARALPGNIGAVNHESIAEVDGGLIFKGRSGWHRLNQAFAAEYIGESISAYDDETPLAVNVVESQHQVRILTASRMLMFDTKVGKWAEWTIDDGLHACMWSGAHVYLTDTGSRQQLTAYTDLDYGLDIETAWIKLADLQGMKRIRWLEVLGEYRSGHGLRIRLARDYWKDGVDTYFQDKTWTPSPAVIGGPERVKHSSSIQQVEAIKIRLTATDTSGEALKLSGLSLELGMKRGLFRSLPSAQRQ